MLKYTHTKIACYIGYVVQAIACSFISLIFVILQETYNISYEKLGRLMFVCFAVQIFVDLISIHLVKIMGYRRLAILSQLFAAVGFASLGFFPKIMPAYTGLTVSVCLYSVGSGLIEVIISPIVEYLPTKNKSGNMALLHSFFCWGNVFIVIATTLMIKFMGKGCWGIISLIWALIPLTVMVMFTVVPIVEPKNNGSGSIKVLFNSPAFYLMLVIMFLAGAGEISASNWMSVFAEQSLGFPKLVGDLVGPCLFAVCMGTGRVLFSFFGDKVSMKKVLMIFSFLTILFYLVMSLGKNQIVSLIAGAFVGLGVSVMWPGILSLCSARFPTGSTAMFALLAMFGDFGCSFGPWMTGMVADRYNLNTGFLIATAFPLLMFIILIFMNKNKEKKK